jgi:flavin reductase (DIM6/NTAB) family NADH-FMN oxidoreductase RutF
MKKARNLPSYPVYSLLTKDETWKQNMNIMNYAIPVSMHPKRYILALYKNTKSLENWILNRKWILQILSKEHDSYVSVLGKKSWLSYDKMNYLSKKSMLDAHWYIKWICWYMELSTILHIDSQGWDHELFLCEVLKSKSIHDNVLNTQDLIDKKIIL